VTTTQPPSTRRAYDNTLRQERAAQTRARIVAAGAELVRGSSIRDWHGVTIRAVATRAGVHERTVYRHFANERALHDAVLHHLEQEAGIDLATMRLDDIAEVTTRMFRTLSSWAAPTRKKLDPALVEARGRLHESLLTAVSQQASRWSIPERTTAAAVLDVLWSVASYERLVSDWELDHDHATRAITWVIGLVEDAVRRGQRPPHPTGASPG